MQMTIHHRYYLTKNISASPYLTYDEKDELINEIFGNDQTDSTHRYRQISESRAYDKQTKYSIWSRITDLNNQDNFQFYRNNCYGFNQCPL